ncbi:MAG: HAMP domain-containing protein [Deltaproteobacteria bacterium]|nr:HAMP domain-containing protein [Deltaproteobacteria bacterium]
MTSIRVRFTLALTAIGVVLFGMYAVIEYRNERGDLRAAAVREIRIIGVSLQVSIGNALRDRQRADVDETLTTLEALEPTVDIHVHAPDGTPIGHSRGAVLDEELEALAARGLVAELIAFEGGRLVFAAPLIERDKTLGTVAVVRPLDDLEADLVRTRDRMLWTVVVFLVVTIVTGILLGTVYLTRPVTTLVGGMRHVRAGDFRMPVEQQRRDEIGELVDEFNAMLEALGASRARTLSETEARMRLEDGLRRIDKLVAIGQLSAGLAHEIGSPLQVLSGRAATLCDHPDPEVRRQAGVLVAECDRIARVVEQLLSFGRRRPAVVAPCTLDAPVRTVIDLVGAEARRRGIELTMETDAGPHRIAGDTDQLQQVALNLISNALAATPRGGSVTVRVDRTPDPSVRLSVRDTGRGIGEAMQARLFEPFFTTRAAEGGSGLGLAVVQSIAREHHARIDVHSQLGAGAEFIVTFPVHEEVMRV